MSIAKQVLAVIAVIVIFIALLIGGRELGWWLKADDTNRQVRIDNTNTGTQTAWHDQAVDLIREFHLVDESNGAARGLYRNEACDLISRLTDPYRSDDLVAFEQEQC